MKTLLPLCIGLGLLLTSCFGSAVEPACDGTCAVITGRFLTDGGQRGIAGVALKLDWVERSYIIGGDVHHKATTTTDADGKYTLRFRVSDDERNTYGSYRMSYTANANEFIVYAAADNGLRLRSDGLRPDTVITSDWLLPRKAYLHYEVTNPAQVQGNVQLSYLFQQGEFTGTGYLNLASQRFLYDNDGHNAPPNSPPVGDVFIAANQPVVLQVFKVKNGVQITERDTIQLAAGDRYTQRITY